MKKLTLGLLLSLLFVLSGCGAYYDYYGPEDRYVYIEGETYDEIIENDFIRTEDMPISTFSTDVDTAAYSNVRRMLNQGQLPIKDAVRIEELVNYFKYDLSGPSENEVIKIHTEYSDAPWHNENKLLMVALKTQEIEFNDTNGMNLVFLIDVSGSMYSSDKLPLLKSALRLLVDNLRPSDRISMVVYAGAAGVIIEGADSTDKKDLLAAINGLEAGGSTAGGAGIELAYQVAERNFIEGGNNRIILASDGDFNVGMSSQSELVELIETKRESGVFLSVLGFGTGNLRDNIMESLARNGNGVYYYIDSYKEAEKVFLHELGATMVTVAKDVKLQLEFNPQHVKAYRLIGYENRVLNNEDFDNDQKDAGDMGSGHVVIAFYEIVPANSATEIAPKTFDEDIVKKYTGSNYPNELMTLSIRYKDPHGSESMLIEHITQSSIYAANPSETFRFASAVVEFGLLLRDSKYKSEASFDQLLERARDSKTYDPYEYRKEFIDLVLIAKNLDKLQNS